MDTSLVWTAVESAIDGVCVYRVWRTLFCCHMIILSAIFALEYCWCCKSQWNACQSQLTWESCSCLKPRGRCIVRHLHVFFFFCTFFVCCSLFSLFLSVSLGRLPHSVFYSAMFALGIHNNENTRCVSKHNHWEPKELWKMRRGCTAVVSLYNED